MARILDLAAAQPARQFVMGCLVGIVLTLACLVGLFHFGIFPRESEALVLSADYRLSRTEMRLREEIRYLEHELALLRRARSTTASHSDDRPS